MTALSIAMTVARTRKATQEDAQELRQTLVAAFFYDPVYVWWIPDPVRRRQILSEFFRIITETHLAYHETYTTDDVVAGAVWVPPSVKDDSGELATALREVSRKYAQRLFEVVELLDGQHPQDSHYYLFLLGTRPEWQSRGIGSALMRPVLEMCDRDGVPAYLEATTERNKRLYVQHGFEVTGEIPLPDGPTMWPMSRMPNRPERGTGNRNQT